MMLSVPFGAAVLAVERSGSGRALICLHAGVAVDFALAHPGKVRGLILIASAVSGAPVEPLPSDIQPLEDALDAAEKAGDLAKVNAIEAHMWLDGPRSAAGRVSGAKRDLFLTMNRIALEHPPLTRVQDPPPAFERLSALRMPVLLMQGALDFPHIVARHARLAGLIPDVRAVVFDDCAHLPSFENPTAANAEIVAFCRDRGLV